MQRDSGDRDDAAAAAERRIEPRIELTPGTLRVSLDSLADFLELYAVNVSTGGMFISCPRVLPIGTTFAFSFDVGPDDAPLHGRAEVRWVREAAHDGPRGIGVAFLDLDDATRSIVQRIVATQRRELS